VGVIISQVRATYPARSVQFKSGDHWSVQ